MKEQYRAYGLTLCSEFALAGMEGCDSRPPGLQAGGGPLALELVEPDRLSGLWSGPAGDFRWRGRLGDGSELTIERGRAGDLLFGDGARASFRLNGEASALQCAPREDGLHWQRTLLGKVLSTVSVLRGHEALHASAVDSPWGAVAIAAPTGMGKTTLALELMGRGWPLLADDVVVLASTPEGVLAQPGTPHMNLAVTAPGGSRSRAPGPTLALLAGERWIAAREHARAARPVCAICLLERAAGQPLAVRALPRNPLLLTPYMLGLLESRERRRTRFELYADLVDAAALMRLTCAGEDSPGALADMLVSSLERRYDEPL
ncbi:MAG TPA: hypothetical protein VGY13_08840, partial [Solirubrobacteraceae bacterium]|nr:hypothetical protein [Solirubrobacteraceae bacterium]